MTRAYQPATTEITWPFETCPECGNRHFIANDGEGTAIFTCLGCAASWRYLLGYLVPVAAERRPSTQSPGTDDPNT